MSESRAQPTPPCTYEERVQVLPPGQVPADSDGWYWLSSAWARGGVRLRGGQVVECPPILRRLLGRTLEEIRRAGYQVERVP